jgi:hypothetical protein
LVDAVGKRWPSIKILVASGEVRPQLPICHWAASFLASHIAVRR